MLRSKKRKARLGESQVKKRTVVVRGNKSSVSVEQSFWVALKEIAAANNIGLGALVSDIDSKREHANLSSAIRLFVLCYYRERVEPSKRRL
jgi:predicted DNA-binding ribbon-helix-helix protein